MPPKEGAFVSAFNGELDEAMRRYYSRNAAAIFARYVTPVWWRDSPKPDPPHVVKMRADHKRIAAERRAVSAGMSGLRALAMALARIPTLRDRLEGLDLDDREPEWQAGPSLPARLLDVD